MIDEALIDEAARRLRKAAPAAQVILFGSSARGHDGRHSDLDFLVVQPEVENAAEESVRLRHALRERRAIDAQGQLARFGHHRLPPVGLMMAAIGERHDIGVLHYDGDYDILSTKTDLRFNSVWLAPRGSI